MIDLVSPLAFAFDIALGVLVGAVLWSVIHPTPETAREAILRVRDGWRVAVETFDAVGEAILRAVRR